MARMEVGRGGDPLPLVLRLWPLPELLGLIVVGVEWAGLLLPPLKGLLPVDLAHLIESG